ncbi:unnamed protein product [Paramecium octaurelia]|uniref:Uncharacterized protein n=1 Tax=Paramecium octaurelia TaxID=43137 RepID=A0A8S1WU91_PAROT|nr:unnamed protein product [Paramecium octaurelia]
MSECLLKVQQLHKTWNLDRSGVRNNLVFKIYPANNYLNQNDKRIRGNEEIFIVSGRIMMMIIKIKQWCDKNLLLHFKRAKKDCNLSREEQ